MGKIIDMIKRITLIPTLLRGGVHALIIKSINEVKKEFEHTEIWEAARMRLTSVVVGEVVRDVLIHLYGFNEEEATKLAGDVLEFLGGKILQKQLGGIAKKLLEEERPTYIY